MTAHKNWLHFCDVVLLYICDFFIYNKIMLKIISVEEGSIAEELGLTSGDKILKVNRKEVNDVLEFLYEESKSKLKLLIENKNGECELLSIKKDPMEGIGLDFEDNFEIRECCNNCIFCFINQNPKGLRNTLYVKDDDFRMSFSTGNYVTLTNATKEDLKRIERLKLSPLYVSVHAVTPRIRNSMLCNHHGGNIVKIIKRLSKKIEVHAQVVLVPGFNDGEELKKTLMAVAPYVKTMAVVPVGLTKYRQNLPKLKMVDKRVAEETIETIENMQQYCKNKFGHPICYAADEFYIIAGRKTPDVSTYENFDQIENGVGMVSKFESEFVVALAESDGLNAKSHVSIATGKSFYPILQNLINLLQKSHENVKVNVYDITNNFFGEMVTTTGLLVGTDLAEQLAGKELGNRLLLSSCMLRDGTQTFLDGTTVADLEKKLNITISIVDNSGEAVVKEILNGDKNV